MRKMLAVILTIVMMGSAACAAAEAGTSPQITGEVTDGNYILTVNTEPDDMGEWHADEMAQDDTVVRLAYEGTEDGVFTARYEPTGDGEVTVYLRHFNEHACDQMHSFDLLVKDGQVQEATGGSYTASPSEVELDPYFSGEWLEQDTQFTTLNATWNAEGGWDIEIVSPLSHGAWLIRARAYYDCDYGAFVYDNGVMYNLIPEEGEPEEKAAEGLWGTLMFTGTEEVPQLLWYSGENSEEEGLTFERKPAA